MTRLRLGLVAAVAICLAVTAACEDDQIIAPAPGTLVLSLTTPNADDGAILLSIEGGAIKSPQTLASSHLLFHRATGTSSMALALVGNLTSGPLVTFEITDISRAGSYSATISQVADRDNALRPSFSDYGVTIDRL